MTQCHHGHDYHHDRGAGEEVRDPVCGMKVTPAVAKHRADHEGKDYFFCSVGCRTKFANDPGHYLKPAKVTGPHRVVRVDC